MPTASTGQTSTFYLAAALLVAVIGLRFWRIQRRRGQVLRGEEIASAVNAALRNLVAGENRFVVLSVSQRAYLQFASQPNGGMVVEANCPDDNDAAQRVLTTAGLSPVKGPPNYRATFASTDVGQLVGLARGYLDALGADSIRIRAGQW